MTQTISDLWNGNIAPYERCGMRDPDLKHLICLMERNRESLLKETTVQQQEIFEKYEDCSDEYLLRMTERAFCDGFCLASKLLTQALLTD